MSKLTITRGPIRSAMKVVIYGPEGIGKTTLASRFPNPLFIDTALHGGVLRVEENQRH